MTESPNFEFNFRDEFPRIHSTRSHSLTLEELELARQLYLNEASQGSLEASQSIEQPSSVVE